MEREGRYEIWKFEYFSLTILWIETNFIYRKYKEKTKKRFLIMHIISIAKRRGTEDYYRHKSWCYNESNVFDSHDSSILMKFIRKIVLRKYNWNAFFPSPIIHVDERMKKCL